MSTIPREPLPLSKMAQTDGEKFIASYYEAARAKDAELIDELTQKLDEANRLAKHWGLQVAKDAELIQMLVDCLHGVATLPDRDADERSTVARPGLEAAAAAGFKPSEE